MRLLVVSNLYPPIVRGGYDIECGEVVELLAGRHDVTVLTSSHRRAEVDRESDAATVLRELDFVEEDRAGTLRTPWDAIRGARTMRRVLQDTQPDLAFVWNAVGLPSSALRVLADSRTPTAFRVCQQWFGGLFVRDQFSRYLQPGTRGLDRAWGTVLGAVNRCFGLRLAPGPPTPAAIAWASEALRVSAGMPAAVTPVLERTIVPTTRRMDTLLARERQLPDGVPRIAFLGRIEEEKGPGVAVRALAHLRDDHGIEATLVLTGRSSSGERAALARLAQSLRVDAAVEIRDPADADAVAALLAQSAVLVVPSVWEEPLGIVLLEGAAAGIPVVASDIGGMPEALVPGADALFFAPGDARACAAAIAATLGDPAATAVRVAHARGRARELSVAHGPAIEEFLRDSAVALGSAADRNKRPAKS